MARVFVSHSSRDKSFVTKLVVHLINSGVPVWYDMLEMELGSKVTEAIYGGIDGSTYFLIVMSRSALESSWVKEELNLAIDKERQWNRKFLVTVKLDDCQLPTSLVGRIYVDFSSGGRIENLNKLARFFKDMGLSDKDIPIDRAIVPVSFTGGIHLTASAFAKRVDNLRVGWSNAHPEAEDAGDFLDLKPKQLLVESEDDYRLLKSKLYARIDNVQSDPYYSPQLLDDLTNSLLAVETAENRLVEGLTLIAKHCPGHILEDASYWFAKILRNNAVWALYSAQKPGDAQGQNLVKDGLRYGISSNNEAARFFGVASCDLVHIFPTATHSPYLTVWVDSSWRTIKELEDNQVPELIEGRDFGVVMNRFIIPQMVHKHLLGGGTSLLAWNLTGYQIGLA